LSQKSRLLGRGRFPLERTASGCVVSKTFSDRLFQVPVEGAHVVAENFGVGKYRHEVCVALPAGDDMEVDVCVDTASRNTANVGSEVYSLGFQRFFKRHYCEVRQFHNLKLRLPVEPGERGGLKVGNDHQVATVVRVEVHDDETLFPPVQQIAFFILFGRNV